MDQTPTQAPAPQEAPVMEPQGNQPVNSPVTEEPKQGGSTKWLLIVLAVVIIAAVIYIVVK